MLKRYLNCFGQIICTGAIFVILASCRHRPETTKPVWQPITESVYASGTLKSANQYQAFPTVSSTIQDVLVTEGQHVSAGTPLLALTSDEQQLAQDNASVEAHFNNYKINQDQLDNALEQIKLAKSKLSNDSSLYYRQKALWAKQVGSQVDLDQRLLTYQDSKTSLEAATVRYDDLKRQLRLSSLQYNNKLAVAKTQLGKYLLRSKLKGLVYNIYKKKGEQTGPTTPSMLVGEAKHFLLEMQVDENDIIKIRTGQLVLVTMDSYKGKVFKARVSKIYPYLDEISKSMLVEAEFSDPPATLYPGISFEANIVIQALPKALLIKRSFMINDSMVIDIKKDTLKVIIGIKDYRMVQILGGIDASTTLIKASE